MVDKKEIEKGDIYYASLDPIIGSEQSGNRPVVVVQNNIGNKYLTPKKGIKIYIKKGKIFFLCSSSFRRG